MTAPTKPLRHLCFYLAIGFFGILPAFSTDYLVTTGGDEAYNDGSLKDETLDGRGLSLREAIALANKNGAGNGAGDLDGDRIEFSEKLKEVKGGTIIELETTLTITDDVVINGKGKTLAQSIAIDGRERVTILVITTGKAPGRSGLVVLENMALVDGKTSKNGGGVIVDPGSRLQVTESIITNCHATNGGGVYVNGAEVKIEDSFLTRNEVIGSRSDGSGGAIYVGPSAAVEISNTLFSNNRASRYGGAIEVVSTEELKLADSRFEENIAGHEDANPGNGGAIHLAGEASIDLTGSELVGNVAESEGGGVWADQGSARMIKVTYRGNQAKRDGGGGVYTDQAALEIEDCNFIENSARGTTGRGGGLYNDRAKVNVQQTNFSGNTANQAGGGIEVGKGDLTLVKCTLGGETPADGNVAGPAGSANPGNGGGLHVGAAAAITISDSTVRNNRAASEGGGLWVQNESTLRVDKNSAIIENTASGNDPDNGGGGIFNNGGEVVLNRANFSNNSATGKQGSGGAILNFNGGTLSISQSNFSQNTANRAGGAIEDAAGSAITSMQVSDSTFTMNTAGPVVNEATPGNGGAVHVTGPSNCEFRDCSVSLNLAASEGGGFWNGSGEMIVNGTTLNKNQATGQAQTNGGGALFNAGGTLSVGPGTEITSNLANGKLGSGGGIFNDGGTLMLNGVLLRDNIAIRAGGGIEDVNSQAIQIANSRFETNQAGTKDNAGPGNGGAIHLSLLRNLEINRTAFVKNAAINDGGGIWNGARGIVTISNSSMVGNQAKSGGGIYTKEGSNTLNVINSTLTKNESEISGGGAQLDGGKNTFLHATVVGNEGGKGAGGVGQLGIRLELHNSVFANNTAGSNPDVAGDIDEAESTLIRNIAGTTGFNPGSDGNLANVDPALSALDESGQTAFMTPFPSSPLIDAGDPALLDGLSDDQRGTGFPRTSHIPDMGAVELQLLFYPDWVKMVFPKNSPTKVTAPTADPDGDCIPNQLEYLTGSDPTKKSPYPFRAELTGNSIVFTYPRAGLIPRGIETFEISTNLRKWTPVAAPLLKLGFKNPSGPALATMEVAKKKRPKLFVRIKLKVAL